MTDYYLMCVLGSATATTSTVNMVFSYHHKYMKYTLFCRQTALTSVWLEKMFYVLYYIYIEQ